MTATESENRRVERVVVLHAIKPPNSQTRYANQLEAGRVDNVEYIYFTPRSLFLKRWHILHLHWPEILVTDKNPIRHVGKLLLLLFLVAKTKIARAKIVRTVHNEVPHEDIGGFDTAVIDALDRLVDRYIVLNESQVGKVRGRPTDHIQHGHYGDVFEPYVSASVAARVPKRLLFFGRVNRYKGVRHLVEIFTDVDDPEMSLRVVGKPTEDALRRDLSSAIDRDPRASYDFAFVPDSQLVDEVLASSLVVLPYTEMNNSGCLLVALSLNRPVLVPRSPANEILAREAGPEWIQMYDGALRAADLVTASAHASALLETGGSPQFSGRDWSQVGRRHYDVYRSVLERDRRRKLFVLLQGQEDNFGDILIRRNMLELLREYGEPNVFLGSSREAFLPQMNPKGDDIVFDSAVKWYFSAMYHVCFRGGRYIYKPGEIQITVRGMKEHLAVLPLALVSKLTYGRMIRFGSGTRDDPSPFMASVFRLILRFDDATFWRDNETRMAVRRGRVAPDLAFYSKQTNLGSPPLESTLRQTVVVSVRGDRGSISAEWLKSIEEFALMRNFKIVMTYQVGRDRDRNRTIAEELSWGFFDPGMIGPETPDGTQLAELYDRAAVVVSDRLHVLVYALTRGAAIVGVGTDNAGKLRRCLGVVGLSERIVDRTASTSALAEAVHMAWVAVTDDRVALQSASKAVEAEFDRALRPVSDLTHDSA